MFGVEKESVMKRGSRGGDLRGDTKRFRSKEEVWGGAGRQYPGHGVSGPACCREEGGREGKEQKKEEGKRRENLDHTHTLIKEV